VCIWTCQDMCLCVFGRARICVCVYLDVQGYVFVCILTCQDMCVTRPATGQLSSAAAVRFGTPCLTNRTQLSLQSTIWEILKERKNLLGQAKHTQQGIRHLGSYERKAQQTVTHVCVCACVAVPPPLPLPPAKAGEKAGRVGAAADQNRLGGVVRKKSNMGGVGRPVGTGGGRGHPRHPQPL
jgi:hypothetical protein